MTVVHPEDVVCPEPPLLDRLVSRAANVASTPRFLIANLLWWAVWVPTHGFGLDNSGFTIFTLLLSLEAIVLTIAVLIQQRVMAERQQEELDVDRKNDAIAADASQELCDRLERIELLLDPSAGGR